MEEEIPIENRAEDDPFIDEISEEDVEGVEEVEIGSELSEDLGSYNITHNETDVVESSYDLGNTYIVLLDSKEEPILITITEINTRDNKIKVTDDNNKELSFHFQDGEILMNTDDYEILDIIQVKEYKPDDEEEEFSDITFETDELIEKIYSDYAKKDDLLSSLIQSMNIYDKPLLIRKLQDTIDELLLLINPEKEKEKIRTDWLIPIIEDNHKLYLDDLGFILDSELNDYDAKMNDTINNYSDYLNILNKDAKPIDTKSGYGITTDEYSGIFLRDCIQDNTCSGLMGEFAYDERKNPKPIYYNDSIAQSSNKIRIVGFLEEPINQHFYSVNENSMSEFNVFEKYLYNYYNTKTQFRKKLKMKESLIVSSTRDDIEKREFDKFILHGVNEDETNLSIFDYYRSMNMIEITDQIIDNDLINESIYNYSDLEKILFKFKLKYGDLPLYDRHKIDKLMKNNIKNYKLDYFRSLKSLPKEEKIVINKIPLSDEKRVLLAYNYINGLNKKEEKNFYLEKFIDLFTRNAENEHEDNEFLYNKYTNEKLLCKHYLYEVNVSNDNDIFNKMKTKYGLPPEDGCIYCKNCGEYLCNEDTTLFDGYDNDKPLVTREKVDEDEEKKLEIDEYVSEKTRMDIKNIIKLVSSSLGVEFENKDYYEILLTYELLDHNFLADIRYGMQDVASTDKHPRVNGEVQKIKKMEGKEKDKKKKKELKEKRESIVKDFQKWLKHTNKILFLTSMTALYIQTQLPSFFVGKNEKRSFQLIDVENTKLNKDTLKYLCAKIRRISEKYESEQIWKCSLGLFNEKEFGTNEIETQLGLIVKSCMEPNFPMIISRITKYEEYIESSKHRYIRDEYVMFRPLGKNNLIQNVNDYLKRIDSENKEYYRKVYGGNTIENSSFIRPLSISENILLSEILSIPEIKIFKNNSFKRIFRYVVSLYGKHDNNLFITLSFQRLLETCDKKEEILSILKKNGWNESSGSFKVLDFGLLRKNVIPEILSLYGDKNTDIKSCYSNDKACNSFIHTLINNYELPLLNTKPKRVYKYKPPLVYPDLSFGRLSELEKYDENGNKVDNIVDRLFKIYKYNELGNIEKVYNDNFYEQFMCNYIHLDKDDTNLGLIKFKDIKKNEDNFNTILDVLRSENSLEYIEIKQKINNYKEEDYNRIENESTLDNRFYEYLLKYNNDDKLKDIFENIINTNRVAELELNEYFSGLLDQNELFIDGVSKFLAKSDSIEMNQKRRFESIFKEYNPTKNISFKSEQISTILSLFINDNNLKYNHLLGYLSDIRYIFSHLVNREKGNSNNIPKEWGCSDNNKLLFSEFLEKNDNDIHLYLHNKIFLKSKDTYLGFNRYLIDNENTPHYFRLLYDKIKVFLYDLERLKGSSNSVYTDKYSNIYMKYHFMKLFYTIVEFINELKDNQSGVTSDANDLFQFLEQRDEDLIDDMIDVLSTFLMDLVTHVLFEHYDPSWLFLNEQKLDLANRLSKQKEREKQVIIDRLDGASQEERFAIMNKQKMGISLFYKQSAQKASEYVNSEDYNQQTESERRERFAEIFSDANIEFDFLKEDEEVNEPLLLINPMDQEEGYINYEEMDEEREESMESIMDEEQDNQFNE